MINTSEFRLVIDQEPVSSLPLREAITVQPATIVRAAVALMRSKQLGCAVIVEIDRPIGIFSERSLLTALTQDPSLDSHAVRDFADPNFLTVKTSDPIAVVWDAIQKDGLRFICVADEEGRLVGLTGQRGLAEYIGECFPQVMVQRLGAKPWMQNREGA